MVRASISFFRASAALAMGFQGLFGRVFSLSRSSEVSVNTEKELESTARQVELGTKLDLRGDRGFLADANCWIGEATSLALEDLVATFGAI